MMLNELAKQIHENAKAKGWHDSFVTFGETIALCHAELSEALEEYRNGRLFREVYYKCTNCEVNCNLNKNATLCDMYSMTSELEKQKVKPEGIPIELADVIIRILDFCGKHKIDIESAINIKHNYNKTRPYKHGNKVI